jgi:ribosomal protein S18 acetylase RimI-like enzyme
VLFLEDLYVRPDHRRQGIGLALMKALAREALLQGCVRFVWEVLDWNEKAIGFYASLGAELRRERLMTWLSGSALRKACRGVERRRRAHCTISVAQLRRRFLREQIEDSDKRCCKRRIVLRFRVCRPEGLVDVGYSAMLFSAQE